MKSKSITYTKNHFSAVVREVREGVSYLVCDNGEPVAVLGPVCASDGSADAGSLASMAKNGLIKRGCRKLPEDFFTAEIPQVESGAGVVDALLAEREQGR